MKFNYRGLLIGLALVTLTSCGSKEGEFYRKVNSNSTASWVEKGKTFLNEGMESTPVVFNGQLLYVVSARTTTGAQGQSIQIWDGLTHVKIAEHNTNLGLISALVVDNTLHIFGTTHWDKSGNSIYTMSTTDLISWTEPQSLFAAPAGTSYFNTSVTAQTDKGFIMAYEVCEAGQKCFNARFKFSEDLIHWKDIGGIVEKGYYTACPTIRYVNSYYYLFFLSHFDGFYATMVSRSKDLSTWEHSKQLVLSPMDGGDKNNNASDLDLVEYDGEVRMLYSTGSQENPNASDQGLREAKFKGSFEEFVRPFFTE